MSIWEDIFGRGETQAPISLMTPEQQEAQRTLLGQTVPMATDYLSRLGQPLGFDLTTPYEQKGLETLGQYLDMPLPTETPLYGGAMSELEKTFAGEYDPVGGEYYQAYRTAVLRELQESKDRLAAQTSARDKYFGGGRIAATGELEESAMTDLAQVLGGLYENERTRRLQAVPLAESLMGAGEGAIQSRIGASQMLGGLEYNRQMQDYLRQMQELGIPLETALGLATTKNEYYTPGYEPSWWESYGGMVGGGALGGLLGGGLGGIGLGMLLGM